MSRAARFAESCIVALAGGAIAGVTGWAVSGTSPTVGLICGTGGFANGAISGYAGTYRWTRPDGWLTFVVDSSWALLGTVFGVVAVHVPNGFRKDPGYRRDLCRRQNFHLYQHGIAIERRYAFTAGNAISNAGTFDGFVRFTYIMRHERFHVAQNRIFGPAFQIGYVTWTVLGTLLGLVLWLAHRDQGLQTIVTTTAYFDNPFEYWAYRREKNWPPAGLYPALSWPPRQPDAPGYVGPVDPGAQRDDLRRDVLRRAGRVEALPRANGRHGAPGTTGQPHHEAGARRDGRCDVFVSYSSHDREVALDLVDELHQRGVETWIDTSDIAAGVDWEMAIDSALASCGRLMILMSPAAVTSKHVRDELAYAQDYLKKNVVPVMIEDCVVPRRLFRIQYADLCDRPWTGDQVDELVEAFA